MSELKSLLFHFQDPRGKKCENRMKLIQLYVIYLISESNIKEQDASIYAFEFLIFEK